MGIKFYLVPDFSQINLKVASSALGQAFFSLSLGMGMLITYGSYINKNNNIVKSAALITLSDVGIAILAGLVIFMIASINFKLTFNFIYASVAIFVLGMPLIVKFLYLYFYNFLIQYFSWSSPGFRLELYHFVSNKIFDKPFFGWGIDSLRFMTFTDVDIKTNNYQFLIKGENVLHPHSWYLQIWLDFGMFGAVIFVGSIFVLMQKINQMSNFAKRISLSALVCSLCSLSFSFGLYQTWLLSFLILLLFLILYLSNIEKQKN